MNITASPHTGTKCPRCWHYHHPTGTHDGLCDTCQQMILAGWPEHESAVHIKAALNLERKQYCVRPADQPCSHLHCCRTTYQE